ncbi:uncharacterized protein LOC142342779 [Convolutriloba macropyga]|uniref:uncharacterized protein LOC142342779 n=1 Tax=Convolutriloba macropyga TaxID=536237 RepID=UPI003F52139F
MSKQQTFQFEKQQKQLFVDANIGMKTNDREYTQTKAPVIQRAISKLLFAFLILTVVGSSLQSVPVAQAFSHTKYRTCSDKFRQQVAKRGCDFRRSYCGYVVVWIPRGGFENAECLPKRTGGYACSFSEQCFSNSCAWGKCM